MYNEHDRPSTRKMLITGAIWVAGIAAVIAVAAVVFGMATSHSASSTSNGALASPGVESPATMTATIPSSEPAPSAAVTTQQVAPSPATAPAPTAPKKATPAPAKTTAAPAVSGASVVVIDAGHEAKVVPGVDPIGPGSTTTKAKILSGAYDSFTHTEESERNLEVALRLQKVLEARGVKVVMVRTKQNVQITNKQRAELANSVNAALFIRLHCDSGPSNVTGVLTLRPEKNWYPAHPIVAQSKIAASLIQAATLAATGAKDRGITPRNDEVGFNWSQVPSVLVEMGLLSNKTEATKLGTAAYQNKLADGMANGIVAYLKTR
ncbi:MAG: N-acetylmuramoyl-L-alanine amidase [Coriobacteriia bacterium]|nr:N-acetylmuramoyl-L-alanine amidase [Coriobacteriia bacterium]